jgi:hypothetical protein
METWVVVGVKGRYLLHIQSISRGLGETEPGMGIHHRFQIVSMVLVLLGDFSICLGNPGARIHATLVLILSPTSRSCCVLVLRMSLPLLSLCYI